MTITEVAEKYEISADTLRYYERIGLIPPVPRNKSGIRNYDEPSCRWVEVPAKVGTTTHQSKKRWKRCMML